jgi:hypothetical protein
VGGIILALWSKVGAKVLQLFQSTKFSGEKMLFPAKKLRKKERNPPFSLAFRPLFRNFAAVC